MSSLGQIFTKIDESIIISNVKINETNTESVDEKSAITKESDSENVNEVNIGITEKIKEPDDNGEESKETVPNPVKKEKTSFLQNGGIFPKIKINRKFSKTKNKDKTKDCSEVSTNDNDSNLEKDIEKIDLNKVENKINTKKNPSEVWC